MGRTGTRLPRLGGISKLSELEIDADKDWLGHVIKNLGAPVDSGDAARLGDLVLSKLSIDADKDWGGHLIKNLGAPVDAGDAARKSEVDAVQSSLSDHSSASPIDHPDGSITEAKIADGAVTIAKLADFEITSPADGQILVYDAAAAKWKNTATVSGDLTVSGALTVDGDLTANANVYFPNLPSADHLDDVEVLRSGGFSPELKQILALLIGAIKQLDERLRRLENGSALDTA